MRGYDEVFDLPQDVIAQDLEVPGLFRPDPSIRLFQPVSLN
jgi:hypothetical protein